MIKMVVVQITRVTWFPDIKPNYFFLTGELLKGGDGHPFFMPVYLCNKQLCLLQDHLYTIQEQQ
jgi:hypothetical protein